jgi:hypothetical protein
MSVYYTERTPRETVEEVHKRLEYEDNRYHAEQPTKLVLAANVYRYEDTNE